MMFTNLIPGITAVAAWLLIDEQFSARKLIGMSIVLVGVFVAQQESLRLRHHEVPTATDGRHGAATPDQSAPTDVPHQSPTDAPQ